MYKLCFYVPVEHAAEVKKAVFEKGAGRVSTYDSCCWQTDGIGQFRPLKGSTPYRGKVGLVEEVKELKIEMVCSEESIEEVVRTLREVHPYECVPLDVWKLDNLSSDLS